MYEFIRENLKHTHTHIQQTAEKLWQNETPFNEHLLNVLNVKNEMKRETTTMDGMLFHTKIPYQYY